MRKFTKDRGGNNYKMVMAPGVVNKDHGMNFDSLSRIHFFGLVNGCIIAAEVEITTVTKITPVDEVKQVTKSLNNKLTVYLGEN